jgi:diguanylate cyclase (GGDEF)-like protein
MSEAALRDLNRTLEARVTERTQALAQEIADREQIEAQLRDLVIRDPLTGLYNRRELSRVLAEEVERAQRYRRPLALALIDLDHFKAVNDTYGHLAGDAVLRGVAALLGRQVRRTDRLARYGGEEFALLFPETSARHAFQVVEALRARIAETAFTAPAPAQPIHLTVSAGVAGLYPRLETAEQLVAAADTALYEAKQRGRNCTLPYRHGPHPPPPEALAG